MGKKGFTLLEITVVLVIIGILASIGIAQYHKSVEDSVYSEAKANLAMLRKLQIAYSDEYGDYTDVIGTTNPISTDLPLVPDGASGSGAHVCASNEYYFQYDCWKDNSRCIAFRCVDSGKKPQGKTVGDRMRLYFNGTLQKCNNSGCTDVF